MARARFQVGPVRAAIVAASMVIAAPSHPAGQGPDPAAMLRAARDAMGGDAKVRALKGLRLTGTEWSSQHVRGGYTLDIEEAYELRIALPDRFLEISLFPSIRPSEIRKGFVGNETISSMGGQSTNPAGDATYVRKKAAEFLLLLLARTEPWGGLTFEPQGSNTLQARGLDGYAARLEFDPDTHLLSKLIYRQRRQVRTPNTILRRGQPAAPRGASGGGAGGAASSDLPEVEIAITLNDRRQAGGILLPHRITTTAQNIVLWELRFERIVVNPTFTEADFR
jgi:hypothetical protein